MKVEIKSKTVENKNNKYTCILYIKNNDIEVKNWQITVSKKTNITWCDKLIINKNIIENNNVPLKSKETLIINYKGNGTIPKRFKFINKDINKESSNQINSITIDKNKIGVYEGFDYEFWKDKD